MYKNILLSVDLNEESSWAKALPTAVEYARAFGATLHVLTVVPDYGMTVVAQYFPPDFEAKALGESRARLKALIDKQVPEGLAVEALVARGTVYDEIMKTADDLDADLIVMASHRPELKDYLLGPNAARVVRHSERSVLVVRN
jgi:nucleotide-binding universal stress UspA family protein